MTLRAIIVGGVLSCFADGLRKQFGGSQLNRMEASKMSKSELDLEIELDNHESEAPEQFADSPSMITSPSAGSVAGAQSTWALPSWLTSKFISGAPSSDVDHPLVRPGFSDDVLSKLMLVTVTPVIPEDGIMRAAARSVPDGIELGAFRPCQYFALSTVVPDELLGGTNGAMGGIVDQRPYVLLVPFLSLEARVLNIWPFDSMVWGDIDLSDVPGAIVLHPDNATNFSDVVKSKAELVAYSPTEGKRKAVDNLLRERGYAHLESYEMLNSHFRHSALYNVPGHDGLVELGYGPNVGRGNVEFLQNRYQGIVSYGPEAMPALPNNVTEVLLGLVILTQSYSLWAGFAKIGDDLFAQIEAHPFGQIPYAAKEKQMKHWQTIVNRSDTWDMHQANVFFSAFANLAITASDMEKFPTLYSNISDESEPCAEIARKTIAGWARKQVEGFTGEELLPNIDVTWLSSQQFDECPSEHQQWLKKHKLLMTASLLQVTPLVATWGLLVTASVAITTFAVFEIRKLGSAYFS